MLEEAGGKAPYAPAESVEQVIDTYRNRTLTLPVTSDVIERCGVSSSLAPRTLSTLKQLDLLDDEGNPTATFDTIRTAPTDEYEQVLEDWLRNVYRPIFMYVDPREDDVTRVMDQFRMYEPAGQRNRMVTLFLGLCVKAGILGDVPPIPRSQSSAGAPRKPRNKSATANQRAGRETSSNGPPSPHDDAKVETPPSPATSPAAPPGADPLIAAYFQKLPPPGTAWSSDDQAKWLDALKAIFSIVYSVEGTDP